MEKIKRVLGGLSSQSWSYFLFTLHSKLTLRSANSSTFKYVKELLKQIQIFHFLLCSVKDHEAQERGLRKAGWFSRGEIENHFNAMAKVLS